MFEKDKYKMIIINNNGTIKDSIDTIYDDNKYDNHLEYWREYLKNKEYQTVDYNSVNCDSRNTIGLKICMEGNIVFIDTSSPNDKYKNGIIYLPDNPKLIRKKIIKFMTSDYDYLSVVYNINYSNGRFRAKYKNINRIKSKNKVYHK